MLCKQCGKEFKTKKKSTKFCSRNCLYTSMKNREEFICTVCGNKFEVIPSRLGRSNKFCSPECYHASMQIKDKRKCSYCGAEFVTFPKDSKIYCDTACALKGRIGKYQGNNNSCWKEEVTHYRKTRCPSVFNDMANSAGAISLHRLVVAKSIGRSLYPEEVVHHVDGNKQNNAVTNLELFSTTSDHTSYHMGGDAKPIWSGDV